MKRNKKLETGPEGGGGEQTEKMGGVVGPAPKTPK